jgi:hypothetical protein
VSDGGLDLAIKTAMQYLDIDMYYFGIYLDHPRHSFALPDKQVLAKLAEWHKGDPKPWSDRMYKPWLNRGSLAS